MLNGHGDDAYQFARPIVSNFSSNILKKDLTSLKAQLTKQLEIIATYPQPDASDLAVLLAKRHGVSPGNVVVTNGATEAIYLIAQTFSNGRSAIHIPTFREYEDACTIHQHDLSFIRTLDELPTEARLMWLCHPNNPTGKAHSISQMKGCIDAHPNVVFVIDQSYAHYTKAELWEVTEACLHPNLILLHSMTKEFSIPGLRLGYFTAHTDLVHKIAAHRMPWSVNQLAIEAGKHLLSHGLHAEFDLDAYLQQTEQFRRALDQIDGVETFPTDTNFFLCRLENGRAAELKQYLVEHHGLLIRNADNFRGLDHRFFRLATQSPSENEQLIKAIDTWIH